MHGFYNVFYNLGCKSFYRHIFCKRALILNSGEEEKGVWFVKNLYVKIGVTLTLDLAFFVHTD